MIVQSNKLENIIKESKRIQKNKSINQDFYEERKAENISLYKMSQKYTNNFKNITAPIIRENPQMIKIFRYLITPRISQMKLSQQIDITTVSSYEGDINDDVTTPSKTTADKLASYFSGRFDSNKVPWVDNKSVDDKEEIILMNWICDKISEQETETHNRMQNGNSQEESVANLLDKIGYNLNKKVSTIDDISDLDIGEYTREKHINTKTNEVQKSDLIVRPRKNKIIFIEAKSVGVSIDSHKRLKEIKNKSSDWNNTFNNCTTVAILEGYFKKSGIKSLHDAGVNVYWSHRLNKDFKNYIKSL